MGRKIKEKLRRENKRLKKKMKKRMTIPVNFSWTKSKGKLSNLIGKMKRGCFAVAGL